MQNKYMLRRLFVFAFALALWATKVGTSHYFNTPIAKPAEVEAIGTPSADDATTEEAAADASAEDTDQAAVDPIDNFDPTAPLERLYNDHTTEKERFVMVMGVKVDLAEIDLLVENEIAAGTLKTHKEILSFRRETIDKKAAEKREELSQQQSRSRIPSSLKKSSI